MFISSTFIRAGSEDPGPTEDSFSSRLAKKLLKFVLGGLKSDLTTIYFLGVEIKKNVSISSAFGVSSFSNTELTFFQR